MKKRTISLLMTVLLLLYLCGITAAEEDDEASMGWSITKSSKITENAQAAFDIAATEIPDAVYEPVALLGEQRGIYCILCRVTGLDQDAEPYYTLVYVGENGVQNVWDLWIEDHSEPEQEGEEERTVDIRTLLTDLAAAQEAEELLAEDLNMLQDDDLAVFIAEKWQEIYRSPGYCIYLDGKDNPADLPISGKHAFVILGFELENGKMRDELKARCNAAAEAAKSFPGSILVCSGGATGENNPEGHTEAGLMKEYLIQNCGIAAKRILIDECAVTTLDNAENTFAILKDRGIETITLVTSSYHQRRANILYETLAEIIRKKEGVSIAVAGNYSCEAEASEELKKYDAQIAAMQLNEMLTRFLPDKYSTEESY